MEGENDNVIAMPQRVQAAVISALPNPLPPGPYTVTIAGPDGTKMWEAMLDHEGNCPPAEMTLGTAGVGMQELLVNLLTGAMRLFAGMVRP